MAIVLGLDIGTSSTKGLLLGTDGEIRATASAAYPLLRPQPGWSEQDPEEWWTACERVVRELLGAARVAPGDVRGIGLSGQMHGSVFLDAAGVSRVREGGRAAAALRPAILWNDQRTGEECAEIERLVGGPRALVELVGNRALTGLTLPKILWLRRHEPHVFRRTAKVLLPKDYIRLRMTGESITDVGDASGYLLLEPESRAWSGRVLRAVDLDPALLPTIVESGAPAGRLTPWAASRLHLEPDLPVAAGSGDNMTGALGAGIVQEGVVLAALGTSGVIYAHSDSPRRDLPADPGVPVGRLQSMCAADGGVRAPGHWCLTGCMLSAGGSLHWCREALFPNESYDRLLAEAAEVPAGSDGLVFLPYLTGERCPHPDPHARGGWIGLTSRHTRGHLVRAVLEGVTFGMSQMLDLVRDVGVPVHAVRIGSGGARSPLWRQLQADVYGCPVALLRTEEGSALGAAMLGGVASGMWPDAAAACRAVVHETDRIEPDRERHELLLRARAVYARLHGDLGPANQILSAREQA